MKTEVRRQRSEVRSRVSVLECGDQRSATPLFLRAERCSPPARPQTGMKPCAASQSAVAAGALPAQSKTRRPVAAVVSRRLNSRWRNPPRVFRRALTSAATGVWLVFALAVASHAQTFSLDWSTIDNGGGTSAGGGYSVGGTIGQPDAGTLSGGRFTLQGGFWPGLVAPSSGEVPALVIQLSGVSVVLSWSPATADFVLETTEGLASPTWLPAPVGNPVAVSVADPVRFFRLRKR